MLLFVLKIMKVSYLRNVFYHLTQRSCPKCVRNRDRPRSFDQVGHQTTNTSIGNKHFSLNNDIVRLTKIVNILDKDLKFLSFKVIFHCLKLVESFQKKISAKNIWLGDPTFINENFKNLKTTIYKALKFVAVVKNL